MELCKSHNLLEETMFLLDKLGDKKEAIRILADDLNNISKALEYLISSTDTKESELWEIVINKALTNTEDFQILLKFLDFYEKPVIYKKQSYF